MQLFLRLLVLTFLSIISLSLFSQGALRGKVSDELGEPIPFVNVFLKSNSSVGTNTDFNGDYELKITSAEPQIVVFSAIGKLQSNMEVDFEGKKIFVLNVTMKDAAIELEGADIIVKANRGGDSYMEGIKTNSPSSIDYINSATFKKTGDGNVPDAVKRVPGVSTVGGYVSVRGLSDRYIRTTLNGSRLPTLDPFTNNIKMGMFPTGLIDNVIITKTMTPDLAGDWSGAFISIETKDFPDQLQVNYSVSFGYNSQTTFQEIISSERSDTDWLGFDNGFRDISDGVPTIQSEFPRLINPTLWQELEYLGVDEDLYTYGITEDSDVNLGDIYHQVALVELGFLSPGQFNNQVAVNEAIEAYSEQYSDAYFFTGYNSELEKIGKSFNNTWFTTRRIAPMNMSHNFSIGNQVDLFKRKLGYVVGFKYDTNVQFDPVSQLQRTNLPETTSTDGSVVLAGERDYDQMVSRETSGWSALANLSYKLNEFNNISFMIMPNFQGQNKARAYEGIREDIAEKTLGEDQVYEERQQVVYQVETSHMLPVKEIKIDVNASYTVGKRNVLDFKDVRYLYDVNIDQFLFNSTFRPDRRYRYMDENLLDSRVSIEIPVLKERFKPTKFKFGGAYQRNTRENQQVVYTLSGVDEEDLLLGLDQVFAEERFEIQNGTAFDLYYNNSSVVDDQDIGFSNIVAGYAMADYHLNKRLRVIGGARIESTDVQVDIRSFYDNNLPHDSPDRVNGNGQLLNPGELNQYDILPSLNVIYKVKDDDTANVNLRVNYSKSLARPSFRELSSLSQFDYELIARVRGNRDLQMTSIDNYDLRLESYFKSGTNVSISFFYKSFINHIELIQSEGGVFTWQNADESRIFGLEIEGKKNISKNLEVRANLTLINSQTTITVPVKETRSMFGQAPYILNGMLSYNADSLGMIFTVSYNVQGPKLAVVANSGVAAPDVYEMPRQMVDLKVSKRLGDHFSLSAAARNLLNAPLLRKYKFDSGYELDFDRYTFGINYILTLSYTI